MKVAIGCDHAAVELKKEILGFLQAAGCACEDVGCYDTVSVDYPDYAEKVCRLVLSGQAEKGILLCGTGIGISITANKIPGIRAALCHDVFSAKATREHNDANVLAMGARVIGPGHALEIVKVFLETGFSGEEKHVRRISKIRDIEEKYQAK